MNPDYVAVLRTYSSGLGLQIDIAGYEDDGTVAWDDVDLEDTAAVVVGSPNVFGRLERVARRGGGGAFRGRPLYLRDRPHGYGGAALAGRGGADVAVAEGHALGNAMSYGGPYVGLFATSWTSCARSPAA